MGAAERNLILLQNFDLDVDIFSTHFDDIFWGVEMVSQILGT